MRKFDKVKNNELIRSAWRAFAPESLRRTLYHARAKKDTDTVSVVVPVYNVEIYLDECVKSIVDQTYKNLEIILVNDGSTDKSGEMAESWAKTDSRVHVIHQENGGLSAARNTGLASATGNFIIFIDSDDVVPLNAFSLLVNQLKKSKSDIVTGNVKRFKGKANWPGWNQSYSHRPELYSEAISDGVAVGVSVKDYPELLFDTTAWNKMFRRHFLLSEEIQFPIGKLYEDMHPIATAYERANGIDVIFENVYYYRVRENNTSITQKRSELRNLADKMEMVDKIYSDVSRLDDAEQMLRTLEFKVFEGDLPVYSPYLGRDDEFDRIYFESVAKYWDATNSEVLNRTTLGKRAQMYWERKGMPKAGKEANEWIKENFFTLPVYWAEGGPRVDLREAPKSVSVLSDAGLDDMSRYMEVRTAVTETKVVDGRVVLDGYAFLDGVPEDQAVERRFYLRSRSGLEIPVPHSDTASEWVNDGWWNLAVDRRHWGFLVDCDLGGIFRQIIGGPSNDRFDRDWELFVEFQFEGGSRVAPVRNVWRGGQVRLGGTVSLSNSESLHVDWSDWQSPLTFHIRHSEHRLHRLVVEGDRLRAMVSHRTGHSGGKTVLKRTWDNAEVYSDVVSASNGLTEYVFDLSKVPDRDNAAGHANTWKVVVRDPNGSWTPTTNASQPELVDGAENGWDLRSDAQGNSTLVDPGNALLVDSIVFVHGKWILEGRAPLALEEDAYITMWSNNGTSHSVSLDVEGTRFRIRVDPTVVGHWESRDSWALGEYHFWLRSAGSDSKFRIRGARSLIEGALPVNVWTDLFHSRWHLAADNGTLSMRVGSPTRHHERGRFNKERLIRQWAKVDDSKISARESIVFSSFMSRNASDSALSMSQYMSENYPHIEQFWAVEDGSVSVPTWASKLVKRTELWFELLSTSKFIVNNVGAIEGYGDRSYQKFVQTWHGTPFKLVGISQLEFMGFDKSVEISRIVGESSKWDLFIAQNSFMANIARDDFGYTGQILQEGYPRNDRLASYTENDRAEIRSRLGLGSDENVVLYAPTWRESLASGTTSRMVDVLVPAELVSKMKTKTRVLLRGHNYNAAYSKRAKKADGVIDVTHYPDINDLILASDILVSDYSSIMIDYMVYGKPIILYVPDIEEYTAERGSYAELSTFTCGQICYNERSLVDALNSVDSWAGEYSRQARALRTQFAPLDDGHATQRVVEHMLTAREESVVNEDGL